MSTNTDTMSKKDLLALIATYDEAGAKELAKAKVADIREWLAENPEPKAGMAATLLKYRVGYEPSIAYSGRKSLNNGDAIAHFLSGEEPLLVAARVERILGLETGFLVTKYAGLNPGQIRMNSGNRLRAALKRGDITAEDLAKS